MAQGKRVSPADRAAILAGCARESDWRAIARRFALTGLTVSKIARAAGLTPPVHPFGVKGPRYWTQVDAQIAEELPALREAYARPRMPEPPHPLARLIVVDPLGRICGDGRSATFAFDAEEAPWSVRLMRRRRGRR